MGKAIVVLLVLIISVFRHVGGSSCIRKERDALLKLKSGILDRANRLSSWKIGDDCCSWNGVVCDKSSGHVMELHLRNPLSFLTPDYNAFTQSSLEGEIVRSLINLTHLTYLDLSLNNFSGSQIPGFLGSLKNLEYLNLSFSQFMGVVPLHLGNLTHLEFLDLSENSLTIENLHFASSLPSLKYLDLSGSNLSQCHNWLNSLNMLPSLVELHLYDCSLPNIIPEFLHVNHTTLQYLDIGANNFSSNIPLWLFNISTIQHLDLQNNMLHGSIPIEIGTFEFHSVLDLSFNFLQGGIPPSFRNLSSLIELKLGFNSFDSVLPPWLFNIRSIQHLQLSHNAFQGLLPSEIANNSLLSTLALSYNTLEGKIPKTLSTACNLQELNLAVNHFSGSISGAFGNSSCCIQNSLRILNLEKNNLNGSLPDQLGQFHNLELLSLSYNSFEGPIPGSVGGLSGLRYLSLSDNHLNGSLPEAIGQLSNLQNLDISHNFLHGIVSQLHFSSLEWLTGFLMDGNSLVFNIESTWLPTFQLQWITLSSCIVGPRFPHWLKSQRNIQVLAMSNSSISDGIPPWFENISSTIFYLDLSFNQITGALPMIRELRVSNPTSPRAIFLNSNKFQGPFSLFPCDTTALDISNNLLQGPIPEAIGEMMPVLDSLLAANNSFTGAVPLSVCNITSLRIFVLSKNQFSGRLPRCWENSQALEVMDLGSNNFSGHIPSSFGSLPSLRSLHLQNNSLKGKIPTSLKNLQNLISFDISMNHFVGSVPQWIGGILSLSVLDVHSNVFEGEIPQQLCNLVSLRILNLANNKMIGNIPVCFNNFTAMVANSISTEDTDPYQHSVDTGIMYQPAPSSFVDYVSTCIKGREVEYTTTLQYLHSIDLSGNYFVGAIPKELVSLSGLQNLNLSGNNLNGRIPPNIGNMKALESLDLSRNELLGSIPKSISELNFLSHLNLSFNHLSGRISSGNQLQTLEDTSIYMGNDGLCGPPLESCLVDEPPEGHERFKKTNEDDSEILSFASGLGVGFAAGFIGVCSTLYFKNSWRHACFQMVDRVYDNLWVAVVVRANQLKRKE